ncbi:MAG: hypothetical protein J6T96_03850 [Bacteroidales bacterium]|nr:hypothetical protein [Bacteroidales bacterium]MBO7568567.1 hypothetical protein [Bacteroidales bacterium]
MRTCIMAFVFVWLAMSGLASSARSFADTLRIDFIKHDTDLWTCGQLIMFSSKGPVFWNENGRVTSGMLGTNTLILCADKKFREFARDYYVTFDSTGLLLSGTPAVGFEVVVQEQIVTSMPYTEVAFYQNGELRYLMPSDNFRYSTSDGFRFAVMAGRRVYFDEYGRLISATVARRRIFQKRDGTERVFQPGDVIRLDKWGRVE